MTKIIVQDYVADEALAVRPDFFREPPTRFTGGDLPWQWEEDDMVVTRSAVWSAPGCHNGCGVKLYTDKETGKFIKLEGDEDNPYFQGRLCARCIAMAEAVYHPDRALYPMKRDPKDRGKNTWERISWDEAYDLVYNKLTEIKEKWGGRSVDFACGTGRGTQVPLVRLAYAFGSIQYSYFLSGNSCYVPRIGASNVVMGTYCVPDFSQYFVDRYDHDGWVVPKNIFVWGNNPIISNADGNIGHWVVDCMKRGSNLVVVDPKMTWLAARADLWMQVRPGTDAAIALAMGKYIIENDLYDHEFVENWTYGFEEYTAACQEFTLERAEELTSVPAWKIEQAAKMMAEKPSVVQWGLAIDQTMECIAGSHAIINLWSITGQIDIPGGMITTHQPFNYQGYNPVDPQESDMTQAEQDERVGGLAFPMLKYSGVVLTQCDMMVDQMLTGRPFKIRANVLLSTNPLACTAQEPDTRMEKAFLNAEFNVVLDPVMTPTAMAVADVILPVCLSPERDGVRSIYYYIQNLNKCCEPQGESKSDYEICWELGRRWNKRLWPGETLEEYLDFSLKETGWTFRECRDENWIYPEFHYEKFRKGEQRPDGQLGFNTPTGRIELYSIMLASWQQHPVPVYGEPPYGPIGSPELMEEYPFILTTGARQWASFHSEHRQIPHLRALHPWPEFIIHPEPAAELGIRTGDWCYLENHLGKIKMKANVSPETDPQVINCDHGWWFPEREPEDTGNGCYDAYISNPNVIIESGCGMSGFGNNVKCMVCKVYKVPDEEGYNPKIAYEGGRVVQL